MRIRTYSELRALPTFLERFEYLKLGGEVGEVTFGYDRWINQAFYTSREWKQVRSEVIVRDGGCDLGIPERELSAFLLIHHMNPVTPQDLVDGSDTILDPNYLITTSRQTHNAIHYGTADLLPKDHVVERKPGDTKLW